MSAYYLAIAKNRPLGLVHSNGEKVRLVAGRDVALDFFERGIPDDSLRLPVRFRILAFEPWEPIVGQCIALLTKRQQRKKPYRLNEKEKHQAQQMRKSGHPMKVIAERLGVSPSTVKRIVKEMEPVP